MRIELFEIVIKELQIYCPEKLYLEDSNILKLRPLLGNHAIIESLALMNFLVNLESELYRVYRIENFKLIESLMKSGTEHLSSITLFVDFLESKINE